MHEIIHLQFGPRANHVGTHAWNIAESLFSYSDEDVDYGVSHDVDWRQGIGREGEETYTPRLILVDIKENFGALPNINALYNTSDSDPMDDILAPPTLVQTEAPIAPSPYQSYLSNPPTDEMSEEDPPAPPVLEKTRFWSDYNRVWYHPRSMNPLPAVFRREKDEMGLGEGMGSWGEGLEGWKAMGLLDPSPADNFRLFAEESDLLQGVQLSLDMSTGFAAMACQMLAEFKDDYPKGDAISIGLMGGLLGGGGERAGRGEDETDAARNMREMSRIFTESQALKTLIDLGSTVLPIQAPEETWLSPSTPSPATPSFTASNPHTRLDPSNLHLASALLATHLSSALLPLRLKANRISLPTLVSKLNWRGDTRIIGLSGRAPIWNVNAPPTLTFFTPVVEGWDFSSAVGAGAERYTPFFSHSVIRGVPDSSLAALHASLEANSGGLKGHLLSSQSLPPPLPLSPPFPPIFYPPQPDALPATSIPLVSTLSTSTLPRHLLSSHAKKLDVFLKRHGDMRLTGMGDGFGRDEGRELVEGLWGLGEGVSEGDEDEEDLGEERVD